MQTKQTTSPSRATQRNKPLDGLRALALISILLYHLKLPWILSGHLGVVVFLVISGYLGTGSIVRASDRSGGLGIGGVLRLWWHRLRRVWPSTFVLVAVAAVLCSVLSHVLLTKMRPDVLPALGLFSNWAYVMRETSYFSQIGGPSPLLHLWYLGVDVQFFLVWSMLLGLLLYAGKVVARRTTLFLAIALAVWMGVAYYLWADVGRVYYGTDTRAFSLLLGSWLWFAFPLGKVPTIAKGVLVKPVGKRRKNARGQRYLATAPAHLLGVVSLAGICCAMALLPADTPIYYYGGFFGISLLATLLLATLLAPRSFMGILLSFPLLTYLGRRSLSIYLWHFPIFQLMAADKTTTPWQYRLAAVGVTLVAAELSYWLVERAFAARPKTEEGTSGARIAQLVLTSIAAIAVAGYAGYALVTTPDETLVPQEAIVSTGESASQAREIEKTNTNASTTTGSIPQNQVTEQDEQQNQTNATQEEAKKEETAKPEQPKQVEVTSETVVHAPKSETSKDMRDPVLIGDSVPGDAEWSERLPDSLIDTYIGRRPDQAIEVIKGYLDQNVVGHVVVYACFSNTTASAEQLDQMIDLAGEDREVYLVGTVNPDGFQDQANGLLREAADRHENAHYVDWPAVLEGHLNEYLWADATHLRPEGAVVYVDMVTRAVAQEIVNVGGTASE